MNPELEHALIQEAFNASYSGDKKKNQFTKVQMSLKADKILLEYFSKNLAEIESWFEIISPIGKDMETLKSELQLLKDKNWTEILK